VVVDKPKRKSRDYDDREFPRPAHVSLSPRLTHPRPLPPLLLRLLLPKP
jgi:hypothetical protein